MIRRPPRSTPLSLHDALPISTATRASRSAPSTFARRKPCSKESSLPCKTDSRGSRAPGADWARALERLLFVIASLLTRGNTVSFYFGLARDGRSSFPSPLLCMGPSYQSAGNNRNPATFLSAFVGVGGAGRLPLPLLRKIERENRRIPVMIGDQARRGNDAR